MNTTKTPRFADDVKEIQALQSQVEQLQIKKNNFYEMADRGYRLMQMVRCAELAEKLTNFEQAWVKRVSETKSKLKKLEIRLKQYCCNIILSEYIKTKFKKLII